MKNVLLFTVCNDFNALELAIENVEQGNNVYLLVCDREIGLCQHNPIGNSLMCLHCQHSMKKIIKKLGLIDKVHFLWIKDIISAEDKNKASSFIANYSSVQELKDLTFEGAQVGYGAFSSYVTFSRNVMPEITPEFKSYINYMIRKEILVYSALERINSIYGFDIIVFHNGRFAQFKPFLEFAKIHKIDFIATEQKFLGKKLLMDHFINEIPHDLDYLAKNVLDNWEKGDPATREKIGRSFFEKRKKGIEAGDKVYTRDQRAGEMPDNWDDSVENIIIFNSSEDEFCAVSKDYDSYLMFPNQFVALKTIFDHYKKDNTKHFYVRIHPNLKNVPYKSHLALYDLKYDNVTIIPPNSSISSYTLLDNSDKVIIFDSTIGVEAAYWGKPVIALTRYIYWKLGLLYYPQKQEEIWNLIDNKHLLVERDENLIKYGYWLLHPNYPEIKKVPYKYVNFNLFNRNFTDYTIMKAFGFYEGHVILEHVFYNLGFFSIFKKVPCTEPD